MTEEIKNILIKLFEKHSQINMVSDTRYLTEEDYRNLIHDKSFPLGAEVKQVACNKWQKEKPTNPCYFVHRYNEKDMYPSLFDAYIDTNVLCVANIQDDEFVETMEEFADGEFFIIEKS